MKQPGINRLYKPLQPTVKHTTANVVYEEFLPAPALQNVIYCYWQLKTTATLSEQFTHLVVADGCIDVYFEQSNPQQNYAMGFYDKFTKLSLGVSFHYVGIRFFPTMFPQLFKTSAKTVSDRYVNLKDVIPFLSNFISTNIYNDISIEEVRKILDSYFIKLTSNVKFDFDRRLYDAIYVILENYGVVEIENEINTGISHRQLRRMFEYYIGGTVKTFSKVVRFQSILKLEPTPQNIRQDKLFYDFGYYDQAHFIKEFKHLYGATPTQAFGR